jgi:hypothetical protein
MTTTTPEQAGEAAERPPTVETTTASVVVVIPIPNDPDWSIFDELPEDTPIIVVDDSDGQLAPPPRRNVRYFDYAAQQAVMGRNYPAIPHKSAATRNFGHYFAYTEGYDVVVALDYDCRTPPGYLESHLAALGDVVDAPAVRGDWINSIETPGLYARGYPYEFRNESASRVTETTATGRVRVNMGVWENVLDMNGVDKLLAEPGPDPGLRGDRNYVALGNIPLCGMNTAFEAELIPAYFFLPDVFFEGWQLSRHDDIWGGYVLKRLMDLRGDLLSYGRPVVEHTRQSRLERVVVMEHYMHLMSMPFYSIVEEALAEVAPGSYLDMFGAFVDQYRRRADLAEVPSHYRQVFVELGQSMARWVACFE